MKDRLLLDTTFQAEPAKTSQAPTGSLLRVFLSPSRTVPLISRLFLAAWRQRF